MQSCLKLKISSKRWIVSEQRTYRSVNGLMLLAQWLQLPFPPYIAFCRNLASMGSRCGIQPQCRCNTAWCVLRSWFNQPAVCLRNCEISAFRPSKMCHVPYVWSWNRGWATTFRWFRHGTFQDWMFWEFASIDFPCICCNVYSGKHPEVFFLKSPSPVRCV